MKQTKMMMAAWLCCFVCSISFAQRSIKELSYSVHNHQSQPLLLHCNIYHPTGEKGPSFDRVILPGKQALPIKHDLEKNCKELAVVVCKLKKTERGATVEHFWVSIPCEKIGSERALEFEILKNNSLRAHYP